MTEWKTVAQLNLASATATNVYEVPEDMQGMYRVRVANRTNASINIRLSLSRKGIATASAHYELYDYPLPAYDAIETVMLAQESDIIRGYASAADTSWIVKAIEKPLAA